MSKESTRRPEGIVLKDVLALQVKLHYQECGCHLKESTHVILRTRNCRISIWKLLWRL